MGRRRRRRFIKSMSAQSGFAAVDLRNAVKVRAFCHNGKWHDIEVEDDVTAYLEFPNGATGVFVTTTADAPGTNRLEVTLEKGKLVAEKDELKFYELEINEREYCYQATEGFAKPPCHERH